MGRDAKSVSIWGLGAIQGYMWMIGDGRRNWKLHFEFRVKV